MLNKETILLIGGTGFIGSNLLESLIKYNKKTNYLIVVLSRKTLKNETNNILYVKGDYSDVTFLKELFSKWNFTKVFHFANTTTPLTSNNNLINDIKFNLKPTLSLLEIMREFGCKFILFISSGGAIYGDKQIEKINENEICNPISSYGVVKLKIENYLKFHQKQFGINYLILRVSNPFGQFHASEKQGIINIAIRKALQGKNIEIWGDGNQTKDYIYIKDLIEIIHLLLNKKIINKIINIGTGEAHELNEILLVINKYLPNLKVKYLESISTDVKNFCLDISLLQSFINYKFTSFDESIKATIEYEREKLI